MNPTAPPTQPMTPSVPPSEPEVEQRLLDEALELIETTDSPVTFDRGVAERYMLEPNGFSVDADGYLRDIETGEYSTPYAYSREAFEAGEEYWRPVREVYHDSDDDPLDDRLDDVDRIHIDDVYGLAELDGESIVVRDNWENIVAKLTDTGTDLRLKASWEETTEFIHGLAGSE